MRFDRLALALVVGSSLSLANTGCILLLDQGEEAAFLEPEDTRLDLPESMANRSLQADPTKGHVQLAATETVSDVNLWVTSIVESSALVVGYLDDKRPTTQEGSVRIYGPYDDDQGRDLAWLVRLDGDLTGSDFELYAGSRGSSSQAEMDRLMVGNLDVDGDERSGGYTLDFDIVEKYPDMKDPAVDALLSYGGSVDVTFTRNVTTEAKTIDIDFNGFSVLYEGFLDDDEFFSDETYNYRQEENTSGTFSLALLGEWDLWGWSGPEQERMSLAMAWDEDGAGRTRGEIIELSGSGDLLFGDVRVDECFDASSTLTWRAINESYAAVNPAYNFGQESSCLVEAEAVPAI